MTATPTSEAPIPEAPIPVASSPVASSPVASSPVASSPVASSSVASPPVAPIPAASSPVASSPVASSPEAPIPVARIPVASSPAASPPVASSPVASSPAASPPVASSPVASSPVASSPQTLVSDSPPPGAPRAPRGPTSEIPPDLHERWLSPFSFRYGSPAMRRLWSEAHKRRTWRQVWVALAHAQHHLGLVSHAELEDLRQHQGHIDVAAAEAIERDIKHDLVAELRVFASQARLGGRILHLGATSMDIEDNADVLRIRDALRLVESSLDALLTVLRDRIAELADHATMAFTHLQPAEPTTLGYRLAQYAQDLLDDADNLAHVRRRLRGKGMKGANGTSASYVELLGSIDRAHQMETLVLEHLDFQAFPVATQTYPRKQDLTVLDALSSLGQSLYRMAYDIRLLQSPVIGEVMEPFGKHQVGSSAMPFKQNPVAAENVDSLARQLAALPRIAWDNAAHSHLERTLDDSANRRSILPEAFLIADTILSRSRDIIAGLTVEPHASRRLLDTYGVFASTEKLLMEATRMGGDRQLLHEVIREHALTAWPLVRQGQKNPLSDLLATDPRVTAHVPEPRIRELLDASTHIGDAAHRAHAMAQRLDAHLQPD